MTAIALTIAGSDSGGGAGIQADLKTFSALGVYGCSVLTALTAQNTVGVQGIHDLPVDFISLQLKSVFDDIRVKAVKIGMLSQSSVITAVSQALSHYNVEKIVLDPVMVAASGDKLLADSAVESLRKRLLPQALLITPNLPEAAVLLDCAIAVSEDDMQKQGELLLKMGAKAVLMKGGHGDGEDSVDLFITPTHTDRLPAKRIKTNNSHGTGCTLSSAITAGLAKGMTLQASVFAAKVYVTKAIAASNQLNIGHGKGPTHHFHESW